MKKLLAIGCLVSALCLAGEQITIIVSREDVTEIDVDDGTTNSFTRWTWSAPQEVGQLQSSLVMPTDALAATVSNRIAASVRSILPALNPRHAADPIQVVMP
jgi:hypothetical protein